MSTSGQRRLNSQIQRARAEIYGLGELDRAANAEKRGAELDAANQHNLDVRNKTRAMYRLTAITPMKKEGRRPKREGRWWDSLDRVRGNGN